MNNDLISRKALREDLRRFFPVEALEGIEPKTLFAQIMHDIDNASTVEPEEVYMTGKDYDLYLEGYKQGRKDFERPQGEILVEHCIEFNSNPSCCRNCHSKCTWFKCSKCSCVVDTEDKFCKHCGADMRGNNK